MHMLSRKDLHSAELETVRVSRNPTTVITVNGAVRTNEEATVYVYGLELFVTVQILGDTPAVLSLGKLCEDHGYSFEWSKTTSYLKRQEIQCSTENYVPIVVPGLSTEPPSLVLRVHPQHRYRRMILRQVQQPHEVAEHWEDKHEDIDAARDTRSHDLPGWLEEFAGNFFGRQSFSNERCTRKHFSSTTSIRNLRETRRTEIVPFGAKHA